MLVDTQGLIDGMDPLDPWTPMSSGSRYYYLRPEPDHFTSRDAVVSMGRIHRFNGHGEVTPLDLNQHHVLVALLVMSADGTDADIARALTHDVHEIFVHDVSRPMKHAMRTIMAETVREILKGHGVDVPTFFPSGEIKTPYDLLEARHAATVWSKYNCGWDDADVDINLVKKADNWALAIEATRMFGNSLGLEMPGIIPGILSQADAAPVMENVLLALEAQERTRPGDILFNYLHSED